QLRDKTDRRRPAPSPQANRKERNAERLARRSVPNRSPARRRSPNAVRQDADYIAFSDFVCARRESQSQHELRALASKPGDMECIHACDRPAAANAPRKVSRPDTPG